MAPQFAAFFALLAAASAVNAAVIEARANINGPVGGASNSCTYLGIQNDGHTLGAVCADDNGNKAFSSLDLNHCLANAGGWLQYQLDGYAFNSCQNANTQGSTLYTSCPAADGVIENNAVGLDSFVGNLNGQLSC